MLAIGLSICAYRDLLKPAVLSISKEAIQIRSHECTEAQTLREICERIPKTQLIRRTEEGGMGLVEGVKPNQSFSEQRKQNSIQQCQRAR